MQRWSKDGLPPAMTGSKVADSTSDYTDSEGEGPAEEETRDERDLRSGDSSSGSRTGALGVSDVEAELRAAERQLSRAKMRITELKCQLRTSGSVKADQQQLQSRKTVSVVAGSKCVLCQAPVVATPTLITAKRSRKTNAPMGPTQCKLCAKVGHAVYCCAQHQAQDAERHGNEYQSPPHSDTCAASFSTLARCLNW